MSGLILFIVILAVIVPLIKLFKDPTDTNNRNRYGGYNNGNGYNNPNVYNRHSSKKITYDWKPDYDSKSSQEDLRDQSNQGNLNSQSNQSSQSSQRSQRQNASAQIRTNARDASTQAGSHPAPAAANTRPSSATANTRPSSAAANTRPSSAAANTRPSSTAANARPFSTAAGDRPVAAAADNAGKRTTAASIRKEQNIKNEAAQAIVEKVNGVPVPDVFLEQGAEMPDYNSYEYNAATYDVPESDAFKYADVVVDSVVHVDTVAPGNGNQERAHKKA